MELTKGKLLTGGMVILVMTEKRYYLHKHFLRSDEIHDKICHRWLKGEELERDMNILYNKYSDLKKENGQLKQEIRRLKGSMEEYEEQITGVFTGGGAMTQGDVE